MDYKAFGIEIPFGRTSGNVKVKCPKCIDKRSNKRDKSLSVNLNEGIFKCHYCGFSGTIKQHHEMKKQYVKPQWNNKTELSNKLVKWFEGRCISQNTLTKLRITEGIEWMPQKEAKVNTVQFNYFLNDELVNIKYRTGDKCFKLVSGAELVLYNIDSLKGAKECIITEGEIDTASFVECGFDAVVSVPNGANGTEYLDEYIELFDNIDTIYIAVDTDKKVLILREELIRRLGAEKCKIVAYGEGCKDANEHLILLGSHSLKTYLLKAQDVKIEGIFEVMDYESELDNLWQNGLQKGLTIGHSNFDNLITFEQGRLCTVTGIPGHGKSEFVDEIVVNLNLKYGFKFGYFSPENYPSTYLYSKLIPKLTGCPFTKERLNHGDYNQAKIYLNENIFNIYPEEDLTIESILEKAKYLVKKRGIKGLVIDPYNKIEHQIPSGMSETNYISKLLDKIIMFAQRYNVLVFLVAHPRKMAIQNGIPESPTLYDINGSANFFNKTDFGITVYRDRVNEVSKIVVHKVKFRHLGNAGECEFKYNLNNGRYVPYYDGCRIDWDNENYLKRTLKDREVQNSFNFKSSESAFMSENEFITQDDNVPF